MRRQAIDKQWFKFLDLVFHLERSSWIIELEYALERFSIRTYLDWFDQLRLIDEKYLFRGLMENESTERFLNYLKDKVGNPAVKPSVCFSFSFRENLTFIATIACVTSNMLRLP